ncbi:MAG TPA: ABC transporter permease [Burkholderiaceae bacterium]|jgi:peptide/nickel transport system permease protein
MPNTLKALLRNPATLLSVGFILLLLFLALFGATLYPVDPFDLSMDVTQAPSRLHLLGTDDLGRDVLAGLIEGIRISLTVGFSAALAATVFGIVVGAIAGYGGGWVDLVIMRVSEFFQVMPSFILAVLIVSLIGPGLTRIVLVIAVLSWPQTARFARAEVLRVAQIDFVNAARCLGISSTRILFTDVLPNAVGPALAVSTLIMAQAILLEASLSFLGLSNPDVISWGRMLSAGQNYLQTAWWLSVFPGLAILLIVLAFNLLGDALADIMNPRHGN